MKNGEYMNKTVIMAILSVMFVAGCVGQADGGPTPAEGQGLVVTEFSSAREEVQGAGRPVTLRLQAENKGGTPIENIKACLVGQSWGLEGSTAWSLSEDTKECQKLPETKSELKAPNTEADIPGGIQRWSWSLSSPWVPETIKRDDIFIGRVFYDSSSKAITTIAVYPETDLRAAQDRGDDIPDTLVVSQTNGPLEIDIDTTQPTLAEDGFFTIAITVKNVGGGTVFNETSALAGDGIPSIGYDNLNIFSIDIDLPTELETDNPNLVDSCGLREIELLRGEQDTIYCDINFIANTITSYPITIDAQYQYYVDSELTVTVKGKRGESPSGAGIVGSPY